MTGDPATTIEIPGDRLDRLRPMHLVVAQDGRILRAGPTLLRISPGLPLVGSDLFERFAFRRPHRLSTPADLAAAEGTRLHLAFREPPGLHLRGNAVCLPGGSVLIDLAFGINMADAVTQLGLSECDFSPTDLAVEMLYLIEATAAAMAESRRLNERLVRAKRAAEEQASTDSLTGLRNRRGMDALFADLVDRGTPFAILHIDLDFFKSVNDSLGHAAGDLVLVHVGNVLRSFTSPGDGVVRLGGDEFVVILRDRTDPAVLSEIAERIIAGIERPIRFDGQDCRVSASVGIAISRRYTRPTLSVMLRDADRALYASKLAGRRRATLFTRDAVDEAVRHTLRDGQPVARRGDVSQPGSG